MNLPISRPRVALLKNVHRALKVAMKARGYRWEERRTGEVRLGLWRRPLNKRESKSSQGQASRGQARRIVFVPGHGDTPISWLGTLLLMLPVLKGKYDELILIDFPGFNGFLSEDRCITSMDLLISTFGDTIESLK